MSSTAKPYTSTAVIRVVFIGLLLDLLSFTLILPLLPRLLDHYRVQEGTASGTLLEWTLSRANTFRELLGADDHYRGRTVDVVLLGGALGSLFSFLQYMVSPTIGRLSDRYGRRPILFLSILGNVASCALWAFARSFRIFLLARIVGGLSEGNVQLSMTIISDVTDPSTRSRGLVMVGIAFALAFTTGPAIGAYIASIDLRTAMPSLVEWGLNPYSAPALLSLLLVLVECVYLYIHLPETGKAPLPTSSTPDKVLTSAEKRSQNQTDTAFARIRTAYLAFLLLFSGMEFTLTFLTYDAHGFSHAQQGALLCYTGILSSLLQGGYVRRAGARGLGERSLALQGIIACALGLIALSLSALPDQSTAWLWVGATGISVASATVVNSLNALASAQGTDGTGMGERLGRIRSTGQLGRACGPLLACGLYWWMGPVVCYGVGSLLLLAVAHYVKTYLPERVGVKKE